MNVPHNSSKRRMGSAQHLLKVLNTYDLFFSLGLPCMNEMESDISGSLLGKLSSIVQGTWNIFLLEFKRQ